MLPDSGFLPGLEQPKPKRSQGLNFKPFKSFGAEWGHRFTAKKLPKKDKHRHLVFKIKF